MGTEKVKQYLQKYQLEDRVMEFNVSSATVELAAQAVGVPEAQIAKTLSFQFGDSCILIVFAGDARVDNRKFKDTFHCKASFLSPDEVAKYTGKMIGGVCPFDLPSEVQVYLDVSLQRFDTVYPAAGTASSAVRLSCDELYLASNAESWVDVSKL